MKKRILNWFLPILALLTGTSTLFSQDAHFSQFNAIPIMLSPSNTGMTGNGDLRLGAVYRNQWTSLATNFTSFGIGVDLPYGERWGFGGYFLNSDEANILNTTSFYVSAAYLVSNPNQNKFRLSTGLQAGMIYKRNNNANLIFDNQFDGNNFDPDLPTGEHFTRLQRVMPDFNFGITFESTDRSKKVKPYIHGSVFHVTSPDESFISTEKSKLPIRWLGYGGAKIEVNREFVVDPQALFQMQGASMEINFGALTYYDLTSVGYTLIAGAFYRWEDAATIHLGVKHGFNTFRISYDFNTSGLNEFTNARGGMEFTVTYSPGKRRTRAIY